MEVLQMEIIKVTPRGYCKGVTRAISLAKKAAEEHQGQTIYVLGMLVHNRYVIEALSHLHIKTIDDKKKTRLQLLDEIPDHSIVIFTAHGISPEVIEKAKAKQLRYIDASCPDVVKTQEIVNEQLQNGCDVLYIGKHAHPEAEAIVSLSPHVHLISDCEDITHLPPLEKVFVTNQTTMSIYDVDTLFEQVKIRFPDALFCEEICNATRIRQVAVAQLANKDIDVLYVVGDIHSNNSNRLAHIAKSQGIKQVYLIDDVHGIQEEQLLQAKRVAVTSGASTPTYLTTQVIAYLEHYEEDKTKPKVDVFHIL